MGIILIVAGAFAMGAAIFGKAALADKHLPVFLVGGLAMAIGLGISGSAGECGSSWSERGSYGDC